MSGLQAFMAGNVEKATIEEFEVSKRFKDENGNVIKWQFGAIDGEHDALLRKQATKRVPVQGRKGVTMPEMDSDLYQLKMLAKTVRYPDLENVELQNSYGVMSAEELVKKMLLPGELVEAKRIATEVNGYDTGMDELVEEAKN